MVQLFWSSRQKQWLVKLAPEHVERGCVKLMLRVVPEKKKKILLLFFTQIVFWAFLLTFIFTDYFSFHCFVCFSATTKAVYFN